MQRTTFRSLVYYRFHNLSAYPELAHGIFTRRGGQSQSPWASLNTGHSVGDDPDAVEINHRLICEALGFSVADLVSPHQVHGANVAVVGVQDRGQVIEETDALITDQPGGLLMLRFADCTPVWMYDPVHRAIGLAHAGWRGTAAGTVRETVQAMASAFGTHPRDVLAGIGPAIGPCCYEVGPDVARAISETFPEMASQVLEARGETKWHLDLWTANCEHLRRAGVTQVEVAGVCTACHTDEWYSHRAEHGRTGRIGALLGLRELEA